MRIFTIIVVAGLLGCMEGSAGDAELAPDWRLETANGELIRLSEEVERQPAIVFFWATWCPYCKALMPHLQSIKLEYGDNVKILAISIKDDGDPVAFVENAGYDFTVLPNGDQVAEAYAILTTPGVIIVDSGRVVRFDLRVLPPKEPPAITKSTSHKSKAAYRAPYWAAEIRKALDDVVSGPL